MSRPPDTGSAPDNLRAARLSWAERRFSALLLAIACFGLIPLLVFGNSQFLGHDSWLHLFIATQDRWVMFAGEWLHDAHPPLFYLLLRVVGSFGHNLLILRAIGIVSGTAANVVIGLIAAKIYRHRICALLVAAAYALGWNMIQVNCDVRSYPLALLFVLLAFDAFLDWNVAPGGPLAARAILRFGAYSVLALLTEYYAILFFAACVGLLLLRALMRPAFRRVLQDSLRANRKAWLATFASISLVFLVLFAFHMIVLPADQPYLDAYLWHASPVFDPFAFLLTNLTREFAPYAPFNLAPDIMLALVALLVLPAAIYFTFATGKQPRIIPTACVTLLPVLMILQLMVLSLLGKYPFGGDFRHQSILTPFLFLAAFLLLDRIVDLIKSPVAGNAVFLSAGILVAASFSFGWSVYPWDSQPPTATEYKKFRAAFPAAENIYGDASSTMFFYSLNSNAKWSFEDRFLANGKRIVVYRLDDGGGHGYRVLRNKADVYLNLTAPETYVTMAQALRMAGIRSAVLYFVAAGWGAASARVIEDRMHALAPQAGLDCGSCTVNPNSAFVRFELVN